METEGIDIGEGSGAWAKSAKSTRSQVGIYKLESSVMKLRTSIFDKGHRTGRCRLTTKEFLEECSHANGSLSKTLAIREASLDAGGGLKDRTLGWKSRLGRRLGTQVT